MGARVKNPKFLRTHWCAIRFFSCHVAASKGMARVENPKFLRTHWCAIRFFFLATLPPQKEWREWKTQSFFVHWSPVQPAEMIHQLRGVQQAKLWPKHWIFIKCDIKKAFDSVSVQKK